MPSKTPCLADRGNGQVYAQIGQTMYPDRSTAMVKDFYIYHMATGQWERKADTLLEQGMPSCLAIRYVIGIHFTVCLFLFSVLFK